MKNPEQSGPDEPIGCVSTLLSNIKRIKKFEKQKPEKQDAGQPLLYYRGQSNACWNLKPSVMRNENHRLMEGEMLRDLMTRQPDEFSKLASALDRWMLAQHHGLYTRFLDISANPLVCLFVACGGLEDDEPNTGGSKKENDDTDGLLYVFTTTRDRVKPYDSDSVSIVANFARLRRNEQDAILDKTKQFLKERRAFGDDSCRCRCIMCGPNGKDVNEVRCYAVYMDSLRWENEASGRYSDMGRLQTFIRQEKSYFDGALIDPRDLFRIFIVQPRRLFPRARAQSGAFLVSAYHTRFDFEYEGPERNVRYRPNNSDVPYNYYRLTVKADCKGSIREELKSLNITEETLCPELEKSAEAVIKDYKSG